MSRIGWATVTGHIFHAPSGVSPASLHECTSKHTRIEENSFQRLGRIRLPVFFQWVTIGEEYIQRVGVELVEEHKRWRHLPGSRTVCITDIT